MADTLAMSHNKGGLAIRTMGGGHNHTISDISSPTFVLQRLEDRSSKESPNNTLSRSNTIKHGFEGNVDLDAANGNPYDDDDNSVIEHSVESGSNPINSEGDIDGFRTPRDSMQDGDVVPPLEDRSFARRNSYKARSEGMDGLYREDSMISDSGYSESASQGVMGSTDGVGIRDSQYFELEYARREAENQVEQMKLQLKSKNSQLEQVQMVLMSYEEEIMKLRKTGLGTLAESDNEEERGFEEVEGRQNREGSSEEVALGIAEDLSRKIVVLQTNVQDLEEEMVRVKLENAQLRETNEFLKNAVQKSNRKDVARGLRNPFSRQA